MKHKLLIINVFVLVLVLSISFYYGYVTQWPFWMIVLSFIGIGVYDIWSFYNRGVDKTVEILGTYYKEKLTEEIQNVVKRIMEQ